jgi:hypothetical protein
MLSQKLTGTISLDASGSIYKSLCMQVKIISAFERGMDLDKFNRG